MEHLIFVQVMMMMWKLYSVLHLEGRGSLIGHLIDLKIFSGVILVMILIKALGIGHMKQKMKLMLLTTKVSLVKGWLLD